MRRIVFVILIVITAALVTVYCLREFAVPTINYVADKVESPDPHQFVVKRLYSAEVDEDAFYNEVENRVVITEYQDEEIWAAAIASGKPEFYPVFYYNVYKDIDGAHLNGFFQAELAEHQEEQKFKFGDISLDANFSGGLTVADVNVARLAGYENAQLIKVNTGTQLTVDLTNTTSFDITLSGDSGSVTLLYLYTIQADTFMPKTVMEDQILQVNLTITINSDGTLSLDPAADPFSDLEELTAE